MSIRPFLTFKAGICSSPDQSRKPYKVEPQPEAGYIYLYSEDDLVHFCWRTRDEPLDRPRLDLVMIPTDGHFVPYDPRDKDPSAPKIDGRIFVLKFQSSSQRHHFWLQSKPQSPTGDPSWFSPRDLKIGEIVDRLLQGEEDIDINQELRSLQNNDNNNGRRDGDGGDEAMEDVEGHGDPNDHHEGGTGGAGFDATGGDVREEGEEAREGGADGARAASSAAPDAAAAVRNFLASLGGGQGASGGQGAQGKLYPLLSDLLEPSVTVPMIDGETEAYIDNLLDNLPPTVVVLAQQGGSGGDFIGEPSAESVRAAREAMSLDQKRALLKKVLRSPQFSQSLASLTVAIREGGLPPIAEALRIKVENGGLVRGGSMPLGGGEAVEALVEGVKKMVLEKKAMEKK